MDGLQSLMAASNQQVAMDGISHIVELSTISVGKHVDEMYADVVIKIKTEC